MTDLADRTKAFALQVVKLAEALPERTLGRLVRGQILRSGMSTAANYRAARRGRSRAEFAAKLGIVEEECDETLFWMEVIMETSLLPASSVTPLHTEGDEILRIDVASCRTAKRTLRSAAPSDPKPESNVSLPRSAFHVPPAP